MSWTDQPKEVQDKPVLLSMYANEMIVEVRAEPAAAGRRERTYYITFGGLFGSQTLRCEGSDRVFALLDKMGHWKRKKKGGEKVPEGYELMENAEKEEEVEHE